MGAVVIDASEIGIGVLVHTRETSLIGTERIEISETGIRTNVENFLTSHALFEATSFISSASGSQKKKNSEMGFGCESTGDIAIFNGDEIFIGMTS